MGVKYTSEQIKNLKIMQVDGVYRAPAGRQMAKVEPLGNLIARAIPELSETSETGGKIYIKPLSVNDAWRGRRIKTDEYEAYDLALTLLLPKHLSIPDGKLFIKFEWGLSSDGGDWDSPIKQAQDIISRKYRFNDNRIVGGLVFKNIVPKGLEYLKFEILKFDKQLIK